MRKNLLLLLLVGFILIGCAAGNKRPPMNISSFSLFQSFSYSEDIAKAYYDPGTKTVFAFVPASHQIFLWRDGKRINVIGGMGMSNTNFRSLADITMGNDSSIYALDAVAKNVKKFNSDGKLLATWSLNNAIQPSKIALGTEQNCYVWDSASSEIIAYNLLDGSELYRFGRFQVQKADHLFANRDYVVAYNRAEGSSSIFSSLGQFIDSTSGQIVYDPYNNGIGLSDTALVSRMSAAYLPMCCNPGILSIGKEVLAIVVDNREVRLLQIDYEKVP